MSIRYGALLFLLMFGLVNPTQPAYSQGILTEVFLGGLTDKLNAATDHAAQKGDEELVQLLKGMQKLIDAWKRANMDLLDHAFDRVERSTQDVFTRIGTVADRIDAGQTLAFDEVQQLNAQIAGSISRLPMASSNAEVFGYYPKVVLPAGSPEIPIHVLGPRLGTAGFEASLDGRPEPVAGVGQEVIVIVKRSEIPFDDHQQRLVRYDVNYRARDEGMVTSAQVVKGKMTLVALPRVMASVELQTKVAVANTSYNSFSKLIGNVGKNTGHDEDVVVPPDLYDQGYRINVSKWNEVRWDDNGGNGNGGSSCNYPMRDSFSDRAFRFHMTFGHTGRNGRAFQNCRVYVNVERTTQVVSDGPKVTSDIGWSGDVSMPLPQDVRDWQVKVTFFDGSVSLLRPGQLSQNKLLLLDRVGDDLVFRPRPPSDF